MTDKVLIAGASGLVGAAAVDRFLAEESYDVVAVSRRRPEVESDRPFRHVSVDLRDEDVCAKVFADLSDVTHVVYAAVFEKPGLIPGWTEQDQMQTNLAMLRNVMEPLAASADHLQHLTRIFQ
jgi:nucleoside-diphosphate-sugar epimerase